MIVAPIDPSGMQDSNDKTFASGTRAVRHSQMMADDNEVLKKRTNKT